MTAAEDGASIPRKMDRTQAAMVSYAPAAVQCAETAHPLPDAETLVKCRICDAKTATARFTVREMMFGFRDPFRYAECAACGCLQLCEPPADLAKYYPPDYYSFNRGPSAGPLRRALRSARNRYALTGKGIAGRLLAPLLPYGYPDVSTLLAERGCNPDLRILDVGCGAGWLLRDLHAAGFQRVLGVDPFLERDQVLEGGVRLLKQTISETDGTFDLIMFHHVLEHIPDQLGTMRAVARLLAPGGSCLVRIPVVSYAWERYREDWVQIDAPRHFVLHSTRSIERAAERAGLKVVRVRYDSTAFQFAGSELYRRNVPLTKIDGHFTRRETRAWEAQARRLNAAGRGDQAAFVLRRV